MKYLSMRNIIIVICVLFIIAIIFFLYSSNKLLNNIIINDNHPSIMLSSNRSFDLSDFNQHTEGLLTKNEINKLIINISTAEVANVKSEYAPNGELVRYLGYQFQEQDPELTINLFLSPEALTKLEKEEKDIAFDLLQQILLAIRDMEIANKTTRGEALSREDETITSKYHLAADQAIKIIDSNNLPFVLKLEQ